MKTYFNNFHLLSLAVILTAGLSGCNDDDTNYTPPIDDPEFNIQITTVADFGEILIDQDIQTMYFFANDVNGESNCNGGCAAKWPPVLGEASDLDIGTGIDASDFTTITRDDGSKQIAYKGWPLYYLSPGSDGELEAPGEIGGDGLGGAFFVAKPDYTLMLGKQVVEEGGEAVTYLVDDRGVSLYDFIGDEEDVSNCSGGCATVWPPMNTPESVILPSALQYEDFSNIVRADEFGDQLAFKGNALYFFATDENVRGNVLGQGGANEQFFVVDQGL